MNAKILRWSKTHTLFAAILLLALVLGVGISRSVMHTVAQTAPLCTSGINIGPGNLMPPGAPVTGLIALNASTVTVAGQPEVNAVSFYAAPDIFLGNAEKVNTSTNGSYWQLKLATNLLPNGEKQIYANATNGTAKCSTPLRYFNFTNSTAPTLNVALTPPSYSTTTYSNVDYAVTAVTGSENVTRYAQIDWATTAGQATPLATGFMRLSTGPQAKQGLVTATIRYGGRVVVKSAPISITAYATSGTNTTTSSQTSTVPTQTVRVSGTASSDPTATAVNATNATNLTQPSVAMQDCAATVLGVERAAQLKAGTDRPTPLELEKLRTCFAATNNIVPVVYAPIAPTAVKALSNESTSKITDLSNTKIKEKDVLKISGKAKPNAPVYIYVFSEPLVLTTTADANGDWSYSLEDPLEPGNHEVYAVVDTGDGQYKKTDPFSFAIGTATASSENPNGLTNQLINDPTPAQSNRSIYLYVAVFVGILLIGLIIVLLLYRRWSKHNQYPPSSFNQPPTSYGPPAPPSNPVYPA